MPPFGADKHGKPIKQITGAGLIAAIRHMQDYVGQQMDERLPGAAIDRQSDQCRVRDTAQIGDGLARQYLAALKTRAFLAVPLLAQGKPVGLLAVDNAVSGRPIPETIQDLLFTIGAQVAGAIDCGVLLLGPNLRARSFLSAFLKR